MSDGPGFEIKDSGERRTFATGSQRDRQRGKGRFDLMFRFAIRRLARHLEGGAEKYDSWNWAKGQPLSTYLDSAYRHVVDLMEGRTDEDHAIAAVWNLCAFVDTLEMIRRGILPEELDDLLDFRERQPDDPHYRAGLVLARERSP